MRVIGLPLPEAGGGHALFDFADGGDVLLEADTIFAAEFAAEAFGLLA